MLPLICLLWKQLLSNPAFRHALNHVFLEILVSKVAPEVQLTTVESTFNNLFSPCSYIAQSLDHIQKESGHALKAPNGWIFSLLSLLLMSIAAVDKGYIKPERRESIIQALGRGRTQPDERYLKLGNATEFFEPPIIMSLEVCHTGSVIPKA